jgi:hypothetical protein
VGSDPSSGVMYEKNAKSRSMSKSSPRNMTPLSRALRPSFNVEPLKGLLQKMICLGFRIYFAESEEHGPDYPGFVPEQAK